MYDLALRVFWSSTGAVQCFKENSVFWTNVVVLIFAYLDPTIGAAHSAYVLPYVVAALFLVCGAMVPFSQIRGGAVRFRIHFLAMVVTFICIPLSMYTLTHAIHFPFSRGLVIAASMPPPLLSLVVLTLHARGSESLSMTFTALSNGLGLLVTPFMLRAAVPEQTTAFRPFIVHYVLSVILPLLIGCSIQCLCSKKGTVEVLKPLVPTRLSSTLSGLMPHVDTL
eukprot:PhF_6_TR34986/c0_g1_i1/m.50831/K14347/SLC10A7, P7; solute carrier family 10 (sodium/bile acid cotransporter), member 7